MIELLVAVAIIAILAALLMPAVGRAKASASMGGCISNLRQIGSGLHTYLSDHEGRLPVLPDPVSLNGMLLEMFEGAVMTTGGVSYTSYGAKYSFGPIVKTWICPGDPTRGGMQRFGAANGVPGSESANTGVNAHSYAANVWLLGRPYLDFPKASQTLFMTDFNWGGVGTRGIWPNTSPWKDLFPVTWHNGNISCLLLDGHVEPLRADSIKWGGSNTYLWNSPPPKN